MSTLSGSKPEVRQADHLFVNIEKLHAFLEDWTQRQDHLQPEIANYLAGHFLHEPLHDWDVSRPAPYFGFEIPDSPGNYWYVWFDAPIGYMGSTREWCNRQGENFDDWWRNEEKTEIHHFIGKDITYFHTLFWPAMLKTAGFSLPEKVHIHGFLTVNGEKMSKSKGTFIRASTYLEHLDPSYLRYYYASKLSSHVDDIDLSFEEFIAKVNSDMVGNVVNMASRTARFAEQTGLATTYPDDGGLFVQAAADGQAIAEAYDACDYARAIRLILAAGDRANQFVEQRAPWNLRKDPSKQDELRDVCTIGLNLYRQLAVYLTPVLPRLAKQTGDLLNDPIVSLGAIAAAAVGHAGGQVHAPDAAGRSETGRSAWWPPAPSRPRPKRPAKPWPSTATPRCWPSRSPKRSVSISLPRVDLRVARVIAAEDVPGAQKLLKLTLGLGGDNRRTVLAGIKGVYQPAELVGRLVICVANLAPRKMKFGTSEGMIVAAGGGGGEVYLLSPDPGAKPGQRVH